MNVIVNGEERGIKDGLSVEEYLIELGLNLDTVVVECDTIILQRDEYAAHILKEGSVLELIRFIGGG